MQTPPPFLANLYGQTLSPVPSSDWKMFCDASAAQGILDEVKKLVPDAVLVDVVNGDPMKFPRRPDGSFAVGPFPVGLYQTSPTTVSVFVVYGTVSGPSVVFGQPNVTGEITEYAGDLVDRKNAPNQIDRELGKPVVGQPIALAVYDPPQFQADPELYWKAA